jgi:hypothetical protein
MRKKRAATAHGSGEANGQSNGHTDANRLEEMLAGLSPRERIQRLVEVAQGRQTTEQLRAELEAVPPPPSDTVGDGGRDAQSGRFAPGNKFSRGNPYARRQADLRNALAEAVTTEVLVKIARRLAGKACLGDVPSAQLLFAYLLGRPRLCPDPDALDLQEWRLVDASPTAHEVARALTDSVPAGAAAEVVQRLLGSRPDPVGEALEQAKESPGTVQALRDRRSGKRRQASPPLSG